MRPSQSPHSGRRLRHPVSARLQGRAQGDAAAGRQAPHPGGGRGGGRGGLRAKSGSSSPPGRRPSAIISGPAPSWRRFWPRRAGPDLLDGLRRIRSLAEITFIEQREQLGLGHAVSMGEAFAAGEPVAVMNPDTVYDCDGALPGAAQSGVRGRRRRDGRPGPDRARGDANVRRRPGRSRSSATSFASSTWSRSPGPRRPLRTWASWAAMSSRPPSSTPSGRRRPGYGGEIQITDAIRILLGREPVQGVLFEGRRFDAGDPEGYIEAFAAFAAKGRGVRSGRILLV